MVDDAGKSAVRNIMGMGGDGLYEPGRKSLRFV